MFSFTSIDITLNLTVDQTDNLPRVYRHLIDCWVKVLNQSDFNKASQHRLEEVVKVLLSGSFWLIDFLFVMNSYLSVKNSYVPIDLAPIPIDERTSIDGVKRQKWWKKTLWTCSIDIKKKTTKYAKYANKRQKIVRFEPWDLVWIHIEKVDF